MITSFKTPIFGHGVIYILRSLHIRHALGHASLPHALGQGMPRASQKTTVPPTLDISQLGMGSVDTVQILCSYSVAVGYMCSYTTLH